MNIKFASGLIALCMFVGAAGMATADDKDKDNDQKVRTVTGCLQRSDAEREYVLATREGGSWELKGNEAELNTHVGEVVSVTGEVSRAHAKAHEMKEDAKEEMHEHGMKKNAAETGHLTVKSISKVSGKCEPKGGQ